MAISLREIRKGEVDAALAFAQQQGGKVNGAGLRHELSLLAHNEEGQPVGAALLYALPDQPAVLRVCLTDAIDDPQATGLIDKALLKAQTQRFNRLRIVFLNPDRAKAVWSSQDFLQRVVQDDAA